MPRPTKLTEEISTKIVALVRAGNYRETSCAAVGITPKTLRNWLHRSSQGGRRNAAYIKFAEDLEKAEAHAEALDNQRVSKAAEAGDWRAAAWRLARKRPDRWGERQHLVHSGPDGGPIETRQSGVVLLPPEDEDPEDRAREQLQDREEPGDGAEPEGA
jgi:hypothetical protein